MDSKLSNKPKIGILYICTGRYSSFWEGFYHSAQEFMFNGADLRFYVFTDNESLLRSYIPNVMFIYSKAEPWPFPTLMRFRTFLAQEAKYDVDYLLFCNANLRVTSSINISDVFGDSELFATVHPGYEGKITSSFPYELNSKSRAYTEIRAPDYVCGGFNGGKKSAFLGLCSTLNDRIQKDLDEGIIAIWHDETHFNRYYAENICKFNLITADYCFPEGWDLKRNSKITVLNKEKYIGVGNKGVVYTLKFYTAKIYNSFKSLLRL